MSALTRHVLLTMAQMPFRLLAVSLVAAIGFAIYVGVYSAMSCLTGKRAEEYQKGNLADLDVRFAPEDKSLVPDFKSIAGVAEYESRLIYPGRLFPASETAMAALLVASDPEATGRINRLTLLDGKAVDNDDPNGVVIDRNLAIYHKIKVGDSLKMLLADETYTLNVVGIGQSPEFLIAPANPSVFVPAKGSLGILFAPASLLDEKLGIPLVNSLLFKYKPEADPDEVRQQIHDQASSILSVDFSLPSKDQFGRRFLDLNLNAFYVFLPALVLVFAITSFLVTLFLLFQWISHERQGIGMLMALGYSRMSISLAYFLPAVCIFAAAGGFGYGLAWFVTRTFSYSLADSIGFPYPSLALVMGYLCEGIIGMGLILFLATLFPQAWLLRLSPLDAVRENRNLSPDEMGWALRLMNFLPGKLWFRYGVRNILRHKIISLMTIIAIALGLGLTISFFVTLTSSASTSLRQTERDPWDALVDFFSPVLPEDIERIASVEGVQSVIPYCKQHAQLKGMDGNDATIYIMGIPAASGVRNPEVLAGRFLAAGDARSIVLERNQAEKCGQKVGDVCEFAANGRVYSATVVGLISGALPGESYLPIEYLREISGQGDLSSGAFLILGKADSDSAITSIRAMENISQVTQKPEIVSQIQSTIGDIQVILRIGAAFSVVIALLFMFCSVSFTVLQRKSEYVMLRILGFSDAAVIGAILFEVLFLGLLAVALAGPIGYESALYLSARASKAWFNIQIVTELKDYLGILIPGLLLTPISAIPAILLILRIPLEQSIRERRCG